MKKTLATILLSIYLLIITWAPIESSAQVLGGGTQENDSVVLKWLGNAGWEICAGETVILIDPFLTRKEANPGVEWKTDEDTVMKVISKADFIFVGHSHADHIGDVPFIAKRFGSKVIGSRTTTNIALTAGWPKRSSLLSAAEKNWILRISRFR
jgi:glyoxylase-like metal-dependent hydrolase (beta-lactamase superfamily II)